jgi:N-acetylglutamate synthase-like GNAT family acetyltransferase
MSRPPLQPSPTTSGQGTRSPSWRLELLITGLGLVGMILFLALYDRAFPSAAINLKLSRAEISQRAQTYLDAQGYPLSDYEFALSFGEYGWASVYLQRTLGIPEANRLINAEGLPIWSWDARWFRPLQKEEFFLSLSPDGRVVAFSHSLPEDAPGASLEQAEAQALAEDYLINDRGWSLQNWELASASTHQQPGGRADHYFEWKRTDFAIGEGDLRLAVGIQGDRVGDYDFWLRVPEAFRRSFSEQSNRASFFSDLSGTLGLIGFGLAGLVAYLIAVWRGGLTWSAGLGPALAVAIISLLAGLNELPLAKAWYGTTQDYTLFWLQRLLNLTYGAVFSAAPVAILWAGGRRLARQVWPRQDKILPRGESRWEILARSGWRGVMLGGMMGGYVVIFYLIATRVFGGWTPMDVPYTHLYATPFPFLGPLESGLLPATMEELFFRLVGISLLLWLLRRRWLALLVPGVLWGFAHLSYIRDPFYLRGVELTITSVFLLGLFFLRFDLTTVIMAHFTYNAGLGALPLLRSGEPYFVASGLIVIALMLVPVMPGLVGAARRRLGGERRVVPQLHIRPAMPDDQTWLASLPWAKIDWASLMEDKQGVVLCLEADGQTVGAAAGRVSTEQVGQVLAVYVAPGWRRRYWGSTLVDRLCAELADRSVESVQAAAERGDRLSAAFWASMGWRPAVTLFARSLAPSDRIGWASITKRLRAVFHAKFKFI